MNPPTPSPSKTCAEQSLDLCYQIESCGASEALTKASVMAAALRKEITVMECALIAARALTRHALRAICDDPEKYWLLGNGTGTWHRLTVAHAVLYGQSVGKVEDDWVPDDRRYAAYMAERKSTQWMVDYCKDRGITPPEAEADDS